MNQTQADKIVHALLYEGYILYPYRPSVKNRQRWTFGGLYPQAYSTAQGGTDSCAMQTECLVEGTPQTALSVTVRFLHLMNRQVGELSRRAWLPETKLAFRPVESLTIDGKLWQTWQESVERTVQCGQLNLGECCGQSLPRRFGFPASRTAEASCSPTGDVIGVVVREQQALQGCLELSAARAGDGLYRVRVRVANETALEDADRTSRDQAVLFGMMATHTILEVSGGAFVSSIDPPEPWRQLAAECRNQGTWPVLVGEPGQRDTMLSSPIILYDYPQLAPESPGDLFDATEIDEILTLRVLTLTDEEKRAAAAVDDRARELLQRTEVLAREQLLGLHGMVRGLRPVPEEENHG